jgi:copper(I)-binding protein
MEGEVMKMRQVDDIVIPAKGKTELKPGGLHIMLFELKQDFKEGGEIAVTINYADGQSQSFTAKIKKVMKGMMKH